MFSLSQTGTGDTVADKDTTEIHAGRDNPSAQAVARQERVKV